MSGRCRGGGKGGGADSLTFGIDIGIEEDMGDELELNELDLLGIRKRLEGLESWI